MLIYLIPKNISYSNYTWFRLQRVRLQQPLCIKIIDSNVEKFGYSKYPLGAVSFAFLLIVYGTKYTCSDSSQWGGIICSFRNLCLLLLTRLGLYEKVTVAVGMKCQIVASCLRLLKSKITVLMTPLGAQSK